MNFKRALAGFLLSFVFFASFLYIIYGVKWIFDNSLQSQNNISLGSISNGVGNIVSHNVSNNTDKINLTKNSELDINAESAISVESNLSDANKTIFEKNNNIQLPIASLTKLMTAVVVLDNYNLSDTIIVDKDADAQEPLKQDVKLGDVMPVESFLDIMLISSSNKSAYALSEGPGGHPGEQKFVSEMNQKAEILGLENTFYADPTGLSSKNVSTAEDLTKLAEYILKNYPKIAEISKLKELYIPKFGNVENTDQLLGEIPEIICSKTGFTEAAKGCLLLVVNNPKKNDYLINVILGSDDRFSDMEKLITWSNAACNQ